MCRAGIVVPHGAVIGARAAGRCNAADGDDEQDRCKSCEARPHVLTLLVESETRPMTRWARAHRVIGDIAPILA
jgi:hypothetical protein